MDWNSLLVRSGHPMLDGQTRSTVKRAGPDLIVGLVGVPLALTFQRMGDTILRDTEGRCSAARSVAALFSAEVYLASLYVLLVFCLLDMLHHPWRWGGALERLARLTGLCLCFALFGMLAVLSTVRSVVTGLMLLTALGGSIMLWPFGRVPIRDTHREWVGPAGFRLYICLVVCLSAVFCWVFLGG